MKYSLRSLMIAAMVGPPLLAGVYFALRDYHLYAVVFGLIVSGGLVVIGIGFLFAIEEKLNLLRGNQKPKQRLPTFQALAPKEPKD